MHLIFGLGNPEPKYENTRHNIGQALVRHVQNNLGLPSLANNKKLQSQTVKGQDLILAISNLYMNQNGKSIQKTARFYKISPKNVFIAHDDLDLPIGDYKIQFDRGPAGHHGIASVIKHLKTQSFWRIRLGIGKSKTIPGEKYVLLKPGFFEKLRLQKTIKQATEDLIKNHLRGPIA